MLSAFIHGVILAFGLILPLGVQNIFVFNQGAVHHKFHRSLPVVITASLCDTLLILTAVLGVSALVLANDMFKTVTIIIGFVFLLYMGFVTYKSKPASTKQDQSNVLSAKKQIIFAASVSLLNPHAILDTIGVIGTSSITYSGAEKITFTFACIVISWLWFFLLAFLGRLTGKLTDSEKLLTYINKFSAFLIWGTAIYIIYSNFFR